MSVFIYVLITSFVMLIYVILLFVSHFCGTDAFLAQGVAVCVLLKVWLGDGSATIAYLATMAKHVHNYEKLFIGCLLPDVEAADLGQIMMEMGCAESEVFLVPGLSLFRRMSCLFCSLTKAVPGCRI